MNWIPALVPALLAADAVRLRLRLAPLRRVRVAERGRERPFDPFAAATHGTLTIEGAVVSGRVRRAAIDHATAAGLQVLDLVPADLPVERALDLARTARPRSYRADPLAPGRGAGVAVLADSDVLARSGLKPGPLDPGDLGAATARLRSFARVVPGEGVAADMAVVPSRTPRASACRGRRAWLRGIGASPGRVLARSMAAYALVVAALLIDLPWGLAAAAVYSLVPYLVFVGGPLSPRDLHRSALLRLLRTPWSWWQTHSESLCSSERRREVMREQARSLYQAEYARGVERFLGPARDDCPWCGSIAVGHFLTSGDIVQIKAGRFTLERCRDCGHVFQNPRLNAAGLEFYYRDFYDGIGAESAGRMFARQGRYYRSRADLVRRHLTPRTWLDVGTGHGHFCRTAATMLPTTAFDGLDQGHGVGEGARRGWLRRAYQGQFTQLMDELFGRYDVVSMHHYLEHTLDPLAELDAAAKILRPGGHLLIELPDPESPLGRAFGRFWVSWLQPQHLHMIPLRNLEEALGTRGLRVVARQRRAAHQRYDVLFLVLLLLRTFGPDANRPWAPHPPTLRDRALRALAIGCAVPLVPLAILLDWLVVPLIPGTSNAYRVLARKDEG